MPRKAKESSYDAKETMPPKERETYFNREVATIVRYAYNHAPAIKDKFDRAGIRPSQIKRVKDLEKIPTTTKEELMKLQGATPPFGGFVTQPLQDIKRIFVSPGPIYVPQGGDSLDPSALARVLYAVGFRQDDVVLNTGSYHMVSAGITMDEACTQLGATVIPAGVGNTELKARIMKDTKVTAIISTASFLMTLIKNVEEQGLDFRANFPVRKVLVGGEMVPNDLRRVLEEDYGVNLVVGYGFSEALILGYECEKKSGMHMVQDYVVEIVDPATGKQLGPGETGEIVVTSLSKTYPFIRLATGDLSFYTDDPCPCGRTSPRLVQILGRIGEAVKVRGLFLRPNQVVETISNFPQISNFQVVVSRSAHRDEMTLKLELTDEGVDRRILSQNVKQRFQDVCPLKLDKIEVLPKGTIPKEHKVILDQRTW